METKACFYCGRAIDARIVIPVCSKCAKKKLTVSDEFAMLNYAVGNEKRTLKNKALQN